MLNKKLAAAMLALVLFSLAMVPETLACNRHRNGRHRAVAGRTFYNTPYSAPRRSGLGSKGRAALTIAAPAAIGAGVGALVGGKKGAAVGALLGGGGGAAYYLIRNRRRH